MSQPTRNAPAVRSSGNLTELPNLKQRDPAIAMDAVLGHGDLSMLTAQERAYHYIAVCDSLGVNPKTQPFEYVNFQGRLVLYPRKNVADQLTALHRISFPDEPIQEIKTLGNSQMLITKMRGYMPDGRSAWDMSTIFLGNMNGQELANQFMKGISKCRRRVTLALVGLGGDVPTAQEDRPMPMSVRETGTPPELSPQEISAYASVSVSEGQDEAFDPEPPHDAAPPPPDAAPASERARRAFFAICRDRNINEEAQKALVYMWYGHESRKDLTEEECRIAGNWIKNADEKLLQQAIADALADGDGSPEPEGDEAPVARTDEELGVIAAEVVDMLQGSDSQETIYAEFIERLDNAKTKRETAAIVKDYNTAQKAKMVPSDRGTLFFSALNEKNRDIEQAQAAAKASD